MALIPTPKEIKAVLNLGTQKQYKYFIGHVADSALIWGLYDHNRWVVTTDKKGNILFPIWPTEEFAQIYVSGAWKQAAPKSIEIHKFMEVILKNSNKQKVFFAVFYTPETKGIILESEILYKDLLEGLQKIE